METKQLGKQLEIYLKNTYFLRNDFLYSHPFLTVILCSSLAIFAHMIVAIHTDNFMPTSNGRALSEDFNFIFAILGFAASIYYDIWLPKGFREVISDLVTNETFTLKKVDLDSIFSKIRKMRLIHIVRLIPIINAIIWGVYTYLTNVSLEKSNPNAQLQWYQMDRQLLLTAVIFWSVWFFLVSRVVINLIFITYLFGQIYISLPIRVHRLHPDGCGGFGAVGSFALKLTSLAVFLGMFIFGTIIISTIDGQIKTYSVVVVMIALYALSVPLLFFVFVYQTHKAMLGYRNSLILTTSAIYDRELSSKEGKPNFKETMDQLNALEQLHQHQLRYPAWPFSLTIGLGVVFNTLIPIIISVAGLVIDARQK